MIKPFMIGDWKCYVGPHTEHRIAENVLNNEIITYDKGILNCEKGSPSIPSNVLDWLLKQRDYFIWEEGADFAHDFDRFGDSWRDYNPYKE